MTSDAIPAALFETDGEAYRLTERCRSPWDASHSHGGPIAVLAARASETVGSLVPMQPVRLSLDLLAPISLDHPLVPVTEVLREGKRVQLVEVRVMDDDKMVATARIQRIRHADLELPPGTDDLEGDRSVPELPDPPRPSPPRTRRRLAYNNDGVDFVEAHRTFGEGAGPNQMWTRLAAPVVEGEEPTPFERAAAAADFGNGMSSALPFDGWLFINTDVTLILHRLPEGEWIRLDSSTFVEPTGTGASDCLLSDERGRIGRTHQLLLVDRLRR